MQESELEQALSKMSLKQPSVNYQIRAKDIFRTRKKARNHTCWQWGMAAMLLLSLSANVYLLARQPQQSVNQPPELKTTQPAVNQAKRSGGYSIVQSDASPDGHHQSVTVIWEKQS